MALFTNFFRSRDNDDIESEPRSGIATPQPDPSDKRLPGIMHSYFTQVGAGSSSNNDSRSGPLETPALGTESEDPVPYHRREITQLYTVTPVSEPETVSIGVQEADEGPPLLPHERLGLSQAAAQSSGLSTYPTPPVSQPSSLHKLKLTETDGEVSSEGDVGDAKNAEASASSSSTAHRKSVSESCPSSTRRASIMNPLSSIVTTSNVHAAHFSNPSDRLGSTTPSTPVHSRKPSDSLTESPSYERLKKLTDDAANKSIPPTPTRALSNQTANSDTSGGSDPANGHPKHSNGEGLGVTAPRSSGSSVAAVTPPKGKLTIKIVEARGLRRSKDPYVVAVFQRNELVSKGPRDEEEDEDEEGARSPVGGIPISRQGSDSGRPMAIPMKSRQSSNVSSSDHRDFNAKTRKTMTNPKWDTEAVFDVVGSDSSVNLTIYDRGSAAEDFLGHVNLNAKFTETDTSPVRGWHALTGRTDGMQANFKGFTFVDESSMDENMRGRVKDDFDDMDEDEKRQQDWEDPFDIPSDRRRSSRMSGVVKTNNEDSNMFNGSHFDM
ncbi:hypothetical protein PVAG01_01333 [Phlyctema vagabunda]|uniref:C2 domain-containing protein n=1 Tax=Phlyctema vagabunda TaxID=108571 RepID=A0ABR4PX22_9HELO